MCPIPAAEIGGTLPWHIFGYTHILGGVRNALPLWKKLIYPMKMIQER
jgi:hypothetical protein